MLLHGSVKTGIGRRDGQRHKHEGLAEDWGWGGGERPTASVPFFKANIYLNKTTVLSVPLAAANNLPVGSRSVSGCLQDGKGTA